MRCKYTSGSQQSSRSGVDLRGTGHCACFNFRKAARALTQLYDTALQASGIRATQFALLVGIAKCEPVAIGRLGRLLILDRTTLSRSLRLLRAHRWINISERAEMRQRFVTMSPVGWQALARSIPHWRETQRLLLDRIGDEYWRSMQNDLDRLTAVALDLEASGKVNPSDA